VNDKAIIINASIFDGKYFIKASQIKFEDGIIREISNKQSKMPTGYKIYDLKNKIISPGFIDMHTHGAGGIDAMDITSPKQVKLMAKAFAKTGVTSFLLACFFDKKNSFNATYFDNNNSTAARFLGLYMEGPFISTLKKGSISEEYISKTNANIKKIMDAINKSYGTLKVMTLAPELKQAMEVSKLLAKKHVIAAFGHSAADYVKTKSALKSGIHHVTHLFNAMQGFHHRKPGPFTAIVENLNTTVELIADGTHVHPVIIRFAIKLLGIERVILITDSTAMLDYKAGKYYLKKSGTVVVKAGAAFRADGTLFGSCTTLLDMVKNTKKWCDLNNEQVLRMVTYNPAKLLGLKRVGRIAKGCFADFNVLDENLKLYEVFVGGIPISQA